MKFIRFTVYGEEKVGVIKPEHNNQITELSCPLIDALNSSSTIKFETKKIYTIESVKILPPVYPSKIVCVGLNYRDHARELKMDMPDEPVLFIKPASSVIGPSDPIIYPSSSKEVDYEVEMAIVISRETKDIKRSHAEEYIGGYSILNDVTARDLQRKDIQWTRAKSFDSFCPIGPCIETHLDPANQEISLRLNGEIKQNSNTRNMIFSHTELLEFISGIMTLMPGDIIATGTPPGVGVMEVGDVVEAEVERIGVLKNVVN